MKCDKWGREFVLFWCWWRCEREGDKGAQFRNSSPELGENRISKQRQLPHWLSFREGFCDTPIKHPPISVELGQFSDTPKFHGYKSLEFLLDPEWQVDIGLKKWHSHSEIASFTINISTSAKEFQRFQDFPWNRNIQHWFSSLKTADASLCKHYVFSSGSHV